MTIRFPGITPIERLPEALQLCINLLCEDGITKVRDLTLSLDAWRGPIRRQVVNDEPPHGFGEFIFDQEFEDGTPARMLRPGVHFADRPEDVEFHILLGWMGLKD